ncbi:cytochrome c oxidase assembly factor CtaG [Paenibacillus pasadenensis]|uniref:cytochrome c oxidase assembly factor CtaG n=1 Tax=Paenibacillus pasadenensis TaxID=217090 RepID=UPI00203F9309|nr:cytochrome c oxidase assembly factor CtaG [Paenibacillus pasadenensis]MCM3748562.1 cytochrome c oxidase assembly factor CtaG [Paenibacillus pasadenensis]
MLGLEYFSFKALWSPWLLFIALAALIGYYYLIGPWREKHYPMEKRPGFWQQVMAVSGLFVLYMAQGGPMNLLGHMMFSFHMANMSLSYLIAPPLIIMGIPAYAWRAAFQARFWKRLSPVMNPIFSLVCFNVLFSFYHIPNIHDYVMTRYWVHEAYYFALLVAAMIMWWQITCPVPEWNRLNGLRKMAYVFASGVLLTPACALIIFADEPLYSVYNDPNVWAQAMSYCVSGNTADLLAKFEGPMFFNLFVALEDQQLGGILMKLVQEIMYGCILVFIFRQWYNQENAENDHDLRNVDPV